MVYALQPEHRLGLARLPEQVGAAHQDPEERSRLGPRAAQTNEERATALSRSDDDSELVHGSGNVFRHFGRADTAVHQTKALLDAGIIGILDNGGLSARQAEGRTGVSHADFTHICNPQLDRFAIDRLMTALNKLGQQVDGQIEGHPRVAAEEASVPS